MKPLNIPEYITGESWYYCRVRPKLFLTYCRKNSIHILGMEKFTPNTLLVCSFHKDICWLGLPQNFLQRVSIPKHKSLEFILPVLKRNLIKRSDVFYLKAMERTYVEVGNNGKHFYHTWVKMDVTEYAEKIRRSM